MMHMTFYWGTNVTLLIDAWTTDSWISYMLTLTVCFIFSVLWQFMEDLRLRLRVLSKSSGTAVEDAPLIYGKLLCGGGRGRFVGAVMFGVNSGMNYLLMLAVMSFNGGVLVVVVVGLGVGYWLFRGGDDEQVMVLEDTCACC